MSGQEPGELRRDIAHTRAEMDQTLAEIEDRVSPGRIKDRQLDRLKDGWQRTRTSVMGSDGPSEGGRSGGIGDDLGGRVSEVGDRASDQAQQLTDRARRAPDRLEDATRGNPLAAGVVAFGLGALVGGLAPATKAEQRLASGLRDEFEQPLREELQHAGHEMKSELQQHAQQAAEETKQTAQGAADRTTTEAQQRTQQVRDRAEDAKDEVQQQRG